MRKILAVIMALCMMLSMAFAEGTGSAGTWYATKIGMGDQYMDISVAGISVVLTLNEDGTAVMEAAGEAKEGTWEDTEAGPAVTIDGETLTAELAEGELTLTFSGQSIIFTQEEPTDVVFAEEKADATVEDYNGTYAAACVQNGDSYLSAETAAAAGLVLPGIQIQDGVLTAENLDLDTAGIGSMLNLFSEKAMELKDGQLVSEFTMEGVEGSTGISLTLLQDGMIHMELLSNGESMFSLFFAPAEAEAAE